ncbi:MAG: glycosyltransferase family 4 protein, partial [Actinomycetes bacterium]
MAKILHLTASNARRGAETFAYELAEYLRGVGHEVRIMCVVGDDAPNRLPMEIAGQRRRAPGTTQRILTAARWSDVIVSFGSISLQAAATASRITRRPFIYRNIGDPTVWGQVPLADLRIGRPARTAKHVVALYPAAGTELIRRYRLDPTRVSVIPRGVDAQLFQQVTAEQRAEAQRTLGVTSDRRWLLYLGALSDEKNPLAVLEMAERLPDDIGVLVGGAGPLAEQLSDGAARFGPRVQMLGVVDARTAIAASDALLLPSRTEGIPGAAIEASLSGVPVVATAVGGTESVVVDGVTGRVVAPDSPDELAAAALDVLDHAATFGPAARTHCTAAFSMEVVGARWSAVIDRLTTERTRSAGRRVLQVTASDQRRGAEVFALQLERALERRGNDVVTVAVTGGHGQMPFRSLGPNRLDPRSFRNLRRLARDRDLIVVHGSDGLWPASVVSAATKVPFVYRNIGD